jgi:hypothetical protein
MMKFANGEMSAVNGMAAEGTIIKSNEQVQEVWIGTTLSVARLCWRTDSTTTSLT